MKCPACGHWNRASFPRCFKCGEPLHVHVSTAPSPTEAFSQTAPLPEDGPTHIQVDQYGNEQVRTDKLDKLALEMLSLHERKRLGEVKQRQLRARGAQRGFAPSGTQVQGALRRNRFFADPKQERLRQERLLAQTAPVDYDGFVDEPSYYAIAGDEVHYNTRPKTRGLGNLQRPVVHKKRKRVIGRLRFLPYLVIFLLVAGGLFAGYQYVLQPWLDQKAQSAVKPQPIISASILDDMAAHTIAIPAPEGAQIYIKELRKTYIVAGGYATFQVADYFWYELIDNLLEPTMEVELTPFIRTSSGEQRQMDPVRFTIDIPLSPINLITPDVTRIEVATPVYNIRFHVMQNSKVTINGEDYSSFVNTQNGNITYNASVQPIGDNLINITVRSQYYRENTVSLVIYREVQDIPLDLASTLDDESSEDSMTIRATTRAGASITVLSPHKELDLSQLGSTGEFSFKAIFAKIGMNTVEIRADFPERKPTIVKYDVYYLPNQDVYTRKAWALDAWGYQNLLDNLTLRVNNTQIYTFTGPVVEIISNKPQLVIFNAADGSGSERLVMVENQTKTQWVLGERYRLYADAYGIYGNIPRLTARYTYKPKAQ